VGKESLSELLSFGALSSLFEGPVIPYILSMAIFLLSGLVNVILFIAIRPALSLGSVQQSPSGPCDQAHDQRQLPRQANMHSRTASDGSDSTLVSISKRTKLRPPDIIITRDSFESVYSSYDEERPVARNVAQSAPAMSYWSPDGSPRKRYVVDSLL